MQVQISLANSRHALHCTIAQRFPLALPPPPITTPPQNRAKQDRTKIWVRPQWESGTPSCVPSSRVEASLVSRIRCICHAYHSVARSRSRQSHCGWQGGIVKYVSCLSCLMIYEGHSKSDTTSYLPAPWFLPHTLCLSLSPPQPLRPWGGGGRERFRSRRPEILGWRSKLGRGCADSQ